MPAAETWTNGGVLAPSGFMAPKAGGSKPCSSTVLPLPRKAKPLSVRRGNTVRG